MREIGIIGKSTPEKVWFIYYLAKLISVESSVEILTRHRSFHSSLEAFEYSPKLNITSVKDERTLPDVCLYDIETHEHPEFDSVIYYSGIFLEEVNHNRDLFQDQVTYFHELYILNGLLYDGAINKRYLIKRLGLSPKEKHIITLMFSDIDLGVMAENQYNERIHITQLSKQYKQVLSLVLKDFFDLSNKELRRRFKLANRSK